MKLQMQLGEKSYDILLERGGLQTLAKWIDLDRKVLLVTDNGLPPELVDMVLRQLPQGTLFTAPQGEGAKSFAVLERLCAELLKNRFSRSDLILALGGGVVGDLAGFAASCYMRGIDFINLPTTTLSQVDSSIGGKTALNLSHVKNCVGAFYQPRLVLIDGDTLSTLPLRHYSNGLVEAVKAGLIADSALFELFERENFADCLDEIIRRSLEVKRRIVEADEAENGMRKILNFGHTIGHGVESVYGLTENRDGPGLLHGEAVAVGILPMIGNDALRARVREVFRRLSINPELSYDANLVFEAVTRDKKVHGDSISIVRVPECGRAIIEDIPLEALRGYLERK